jgi:hypothetical protein
MIPWYCAFATGIPALCWKETRSAWSNKDWWRRTICRRTCSRVGHHGSNTSSTAELLNAVHPRWAIISVGARNTFGHPRIETLKRPGRVGHSHLSHRPERCGDVLPRRALGQPAVGVSSLISTSAVSSSVAGDWRYVSMTWVACSASSSRTRITVPPTPGNIS